MTADSEQAEHDTTMIEGVISEAAAADNYDYLTNKFLRMLHQNRKQYLDMVYGVRKPVMALSSLVINQSVLRVNIFTLKIRNT